MADKIAESLLVQVDHGEGLLLRLYRLQKDLNSQQSHLGFIHRERPFPSLFKNVANLNSKALQTYKLSSKHLEEVSAISDKICELLSPTLNVVQDCFDYVQATKSLFKLIGELSLNFDPSTAPDMTKLFLELCSTLIRVLILASRIGPLVKLIMVTVRGCTVQSGDYKISADLCEFVAGALSKPLVFAYELATPCRYF